MVRSETRLEEYSASSGAISQLLSNINGTQVGDPDRAANIMIKLVEDENPPIRLALGKAAVARIRGKAELVLKEVNANEALSGSADFEKT